MIMTNIESLRKQKETITFGKSVIEVIKEKYADLIDDTLELSYVGDMIEELFLHDPESSTLLYREGYRGDIVSLDKSSYRVYGVQDQNKTLKKLSLEDITVEFAGTSRWHAIFTVKLSSLFILTDPKAYADYIISNREKNAEEDYKSTLKHIQNTKDKYTRLIELGIYINSDTSLYNTILRAEAIRGTKLTKENVKDVLKAMQSDFMN